MPTKQPLKADQRGPGEEREGGECLVVVIRRTGNTISAHGVAGERILVGGTSLYGRKVHKRGERRASHACPQFKQFPNSEPVVGVAYLALG
jgi:hypothetical protein